MFLTIWIKECKELFRSLLYWIVVALFVLNMASQMGGFGEESAMEQLQSPVPGQESYGWKQTSDPALIMQQTLYNLILDIESGSFSTYPYGFIRVVHPPEEEIEEFADILERASGRDYAELEQQAVDSLDDSESFEELAYHADLQLQEAYTYEQFASDMEHICEMIGKGSYYEKSSYESAAVEPKTYDDAIEEYEELFDRDRVTRALMRMFCDYGGISLAILAIFPGVAAVLRDRRAKCSEVIGTRSVATSVLLLARFLANAVMFIIPVLFTAAVMELPYLFASEELGRSADVLACVWIPFMWLVPELLTVLSLSFLLTELAGGICAVVVQIIWGFGSVAVQSLAGGFGMHLILRWNRFGGYSDFAEELRMLQINRVVYLGLAILFLLLEIIVSDWKRKHDGYMPWNRWMEEKLWTKLPRRGSV